MTFLFSLSLSSPSSKPLSLLDKTPSLSSFSLSLSLPTKPKFLSLSLSAAKSQTGPAKKPKTKKPKTNKKNADKVDQFTAETTAYEDEAGYVNTTPLPKPPAGFVVDEYGKVLMVAPKRTATIVDPANNLPLECAIRRVFTSSQGDECMLVCPLDMPILILKSTNIEGWSAVSDDEVDDILPTAAYALAKIQLHLVHSGFCYTARGGFCYSEDDVFDFHSDTGEAVEGLPTEGVEITCFQLDGAHYMIYTPSDPLLFVVVKDENGQFQIADDDLLEDPAIISAIDEETEFNALVEEEEALLESLLGDR